MGSEQSSQANSSQASRIGQLRRGKSVPESKRTQEQENMESSRPGSISPGPSVCSDSDLPYISYTVNRPIGDSPKLPVKQQGQLSRGKSLGATGGLLSSPGRRVGLRKATTPRTAVTVPAHNIVVVKPALAQETTDKDVDILRLQSIPMFLPIMRGTLNLPAARDPEVLERLDPSALYRLCLHYQDYLRQSASLVADEQTSISIKIKEIDNEVTRFLQLMTERQKTFAKYAERLAKVSDVSHQLNRCHLLLNQTLDTLESLNNSLPSDERLEPFVWTTG
ncbi:BLOC-1-related complex subunit 5 [Macrosteles quadrilineatus]|uniref:BLOC-1-related complex subunit 5 n=1 Tax=Macrosteles quadrilineatus TaxID=74068 RepID=UPI0023E26837|nr:BLOC-1-related complex subunit 5 [Macrosteles quadrilineatus]